jgi:sugar phosphate isomerase/epimerase
MKLGIYGFGHLVDPTHKYRLIKESGFDYTAIWWGDEYENTAGGKKEHLIELAKNAGLIIENAHAPFAYANSIWQDDIDTKEALAVYTDAIMGCGRHNIPTVVMHLTCGKTPPPANIKGINNIKKLVDIAERENVDIAIENTRNTEYLDYIMSKITSEKLKLCYDSGHANCFYKTDMLSRYPDKIAVLHLHDNDGITDQHLLPGEGNIDWTELSLKIRACNYQGPVSLEVTNTNSAIYKDYSMIDYLKVAAEKAKALARLIKE